MPLLGRRAAWDDAPDADNEFRPSVPFPPRSALGSGLDGGAKPPLSSGVAARLRSGWFETCANPTCRSGWLHLWRSHTTPVFEGGWTCSPECTLTRIGAAVARELDGRGAVRETHRHRIPIGLLMLQTGWITQAQLRRAVEAQKAAGTGRLGQWLMNQQAIGEEMLTRALALQWNCPVLSTEQHDPGAMTAVMPRLFVDAFGALPLRLAAGRLLYLGFEESLDPILTLALERMTGWRVESGVVANSAFTHAHGRMLDARFPPVELIEAVSGPAAAHALARSVERAKPGAARLVRVHDCLWLRMWERAGLGTEPGSGWTRDLVCSIGI
jgi:hypothetical protein